MQNGPALTATETVNFAPVTATERVVELRQQLDDLKFTHAAAESKLQRLTGELTAKNQQLERAESEIQLALRECESVRSDLDGWRQDVVQLRERLRRHQLQESEALNELEYRLAETLARYLPEMSTSGKDEVDAWHNFPATLLPEPLGEGD